MSNSSEVPSLEEIAAHAERFDQGMLALRKDLADRVVAARDDYDLVEVVVDTKGGVVSVAVNETLVRRVSTQTLANSILRAAQEAQREAQAVRRQRKSYYLGDGKGER